MKIFKNDDQKKTLIKAIRKAGSVTQIVAEEYLDYVQQKKMHEYLLWHRSATYFDAVFAPDSVHHNKMVCVDERNCPFHPKEAA